MPLTRDDKAELLDIYEKGLATTPHAFILGYQGIKVPQVTALREKVRQSGGEYIVVKNTLALRAIEGAQIKDIAALPSRNELIAKLLFLLQSPITGLARVLAAVPQSFVMVLDQIRQKKDGPAAEASPAAEPTDSAEPAA